MRLAKERLLGHTALVWTGRLLCVLLVVVLLAPAGAGARSGGSSGHSSSSHSSSSSGSSSSSSSSSSSHYHYRNGVLYFGNHTASYCNRHPGACNSTSTGSGIGGGIVALIIFGFFGIFLLIPILVVVLVRRSRARATAAPAGAAQYSGGVQWAGPGWQVPNTETKEELKRVAAARQAATAADVDDGYWNPDQLEQRFREAWSRTQQAWTTGDMSSARDVMSDALFTRQQSQLEGLRRQGRVNRVADITLDTVHLVNIYNVTDDQEDRFVVHLKGQARDWMEDQAGNMVSGSQELQGFTEYWTFARHPQFGWVVDEVQQEGEGGYHLTEEDVSEDEGPATYERTDA